MEPFSRLDATHDLDLTLSVLRDLGWVELCGNRLLDLGEECDDGEANSDSAPSACRKRCVRAACGDGVVDNGEGCDQGKANSDSTPNGCRVGCLKARCGDGVLDSAESCDRGKDNSDALSDACRTDCRVARCGDGVVDALEQCDGSPGCTTTCVLAPLLAPAAEPTREPEPAAEPVDEQKSDGPKPVWEDLPDGDRPSKRRPKSDCALAPGPASTWVEPAFALSGLFILLARRRASQHARKSS
jgi:MYXO-CTERM domain-containing protein